MYIEREHYTTYLKIVVLFMSVRFFFFASYAQHPPKPHTHKHTNTQTYIYSACY